MASRQMRNRNRTGGDGGMNASHDRRLSKLEQANLEGKRWPAGRIIYVWRHAGSETAEQAIARSFPGGLPRGARLVICSWQVAGSCENPISPGVA